MRRFDGPYFRLVTLGFFLSLTHPAAVRAGWISEIAPLGCQVYNDDAQLTTLPPWLELSGLDQLGQVEVVIIDATKNSSRYGLVRQVIAVAPAVSGQGPDVRLVLGGAWPARMSPVNPLDHTSGMTTQIFPALDLLAVGGQQIAPRSILLFNQPSGLQPGNYISAAKPSVIGGALLQDVVTLGRISSTQTYGLEPVCDLTPAMTLTRPRRTQSSPQPPLYTSGTDDPYAYLAGNPDAYGLLTFDFASYYLNPGLPNPTLVLAPTHHPEPSSLSLLILAGARFLRGARPQKGDIHN